MEGRLFGGSGKRAERVVDRDVVFVSLCVRGGDKGDEGSEPSDT